MLSARAKAFTVDSLLGLEEHTNDVRKLGQRNRGGHDDDSCKTSVYQVTHDCPNKSVYHLKQGGLKSSSLKLAPMFSPKLREDLTDFMGSHPDHPRHHKQHRMSAYTEAPRGKHKAADGRDEETRPRAKKLKTESKSLLGKNLEKKETEHTNSSKLPSFDITQKEIDLSENVGQKEHASQSSCRAHGIAFSMTNSFECMPFPVHKTGKNELGQNAVDLPEDLSTSNRMKDENADVTESRTDTKPTENIVKQEPRYLDVGLRRCSEHNWADSSTAGILHSGTMSTDGGMEKRGPSEHPFRTENARSSPSFYPFASGSSSCQEDKKTRIPSESDGVNTETSTRTPSENSRKDPSSVTRANREHADTDAKAVSATNKEPGLSFTHTPSCARSPILEELLPSNPKLPDACHRDDYKHISSPLTYSLTPVKPVSVSRSLNPNECGVETNLFTRWAGFHGPRSLVPLPGSEKEADWDLEVRALKNEEEKGEASSGLGDWCNFPGTGYLSLCWHPSVVTAKVQGVSQMPRVEAKLCQADQWHEFHRLGTEMVITKMGRRMFPALRLKLRGLEPDARYTVRLELAQCGTDKYRYIYHESMWVVTGSVEEESCAVERMYDHPDSPLLGHTLLTQTVSFEKVKLTNNPHPADSSQIQLTSMQKFQPIIHLETVPEDGDDVTKPVHMTFVFPQTSFIAVTAYQNKQITRLKIARNPFAKGFREKEERKVPSAHGLSPVAACPPSPFHYTPRSLVYPAHHFAAGNELPDRNFQERLHSHVMTSVAENAHFLMAPSSYPPLPLPPWPTYCDSVPLCLKKDTSQSSPTMLNSISDIGVLR